jgi:hypothetical protein
LLSAPTLTPKEAKSKNKIPFSFLFSYVACLDFDVTPKFADDPVFSPVFINVDVAVFKVKMGFD